MNLWQANQSRPLDGIRFMFLPATLLFYARPFPAAATSHSPPQLSSSSSSHPTAVKQLAVQQLGALVVLPTSCPQPATGCAALLGVVPHHSISLLA